MTDVRKLPPQAPGGLASAPADRVALAMLVVLVLLAIGQLGFNAVTLDTWMDEGKYLMKGLWYVTGQVPPYSDIDPTFYMPLFFYEVGIAQWLFGVGYLPGRLLMVACSIGCLALVYLLGKRIGGSRLAGVAAAAILVGQPVTLTYFATATPYAIVSFLSLLMIFALLTVKSRPLAFALSGLILWALFFNRQNMLPIAMLPAGWALLFERRRKVECLAIAVVVFCLASAVTLWVFGRGLFDVVLETPGLSEIARVLGVPPAPTVRIVPLTTSPLDPVFTAGDVIGYFRSYFIRPYGAVTLLTLLALALRAILSWRNPSERRIEPIDLILVYFWVMTFIHFFFSLSYCVDCITPYTNYFLPVGVLAAAVLVRDASRILPLRRPAAAVLGGVLVVAVLTRIFPAFPSLLRPGADGTRPLAEKLAVQLRPVLPQGGKVAVLGDNVALAQAVWLAGGVVESRTVYLPTTFRDPKPELSAAAREEAEGLLWQAGLWDASRLRRAVTEDYRVLLVERDAPPREPLKSTVRDGIPFGDVVAQHFRRTATVTAGGRTIELYLRRE
jgi:hypothetical protein